MKLESSSFVQLSVLHVFGDMFRPVYIYIYSGVLFFSFFSSCLGVFFVNCCFHFSIRTSL